MVGTEVGTEKVCKAGYCWGREVWRGSGRCVGTVRAVWLSWDRIQDMRCSYWSSSWGRSL